MTSADDARGELAAEIDAAFEKYLNATDPATKDIAAVMLRQILWDNTAGIIAYLRAAPVPQCDAEPVAWRWKTTHGPWQITEWKPEQPFSELIPLYATPPSRSDAEMETSLRQEIIRGLQEARSFPDKAGEIIDRIVAALVSRPDQGTVAVASADREGA